MNAKVLNGIKVSAQVLVEKKPFLNKNYHDLDETIDSILNASTPARKAHATRRLWAYALGHAAAIGSTPKRVMAGVCAAVTKRMNPNKKAVCDKRLSDLENFRKQMKELQAKIDNLQKC